MTLLNWISIIIATTYTEYFRCKRMGSDMKSTGIVRKVDELGRIVLPIELRRTLDIAERDELEIYLDDDKVILKKYEPSCIFCGSSCGLVTYQGRNVCMECIENMSNI